MGASTRWLPSSFSAVSQDVALDREAQYPVFAEVRLELVHLVLEGGHSRLAFGTLLVVRLGLLVVAFSLLVVAFSLLVVLAGSLSASSLCWSSASSLGSASTSASSEASSGRSR